MPSWRLYAHGHAVSLALPSLMQGVSTSPGPQPGGPVAPRATGSLMLGLLTGPDPLPAVFLQRLAAPFRPRHLGVAAPALRRASGVLAKALILCTLSGLWPPRVSPRLSVHGYVTAV